MDEYEVIKKLFLPLSFKNKLSLNLDDDAALLPKKKTDNCWNRLYS